MSPETNPTELITPTLSAETISDNTEQEVSATEERGGIEARALHEGPAMGAGRGESDTSSSNASTESQNPFLATPEERTEMTAKREAEGGTWEVDDKEIPTDTESVGRIDPNSIGAQALEAASRSLLEATNPVKDSENSVQ